MRNKLKNDLSKLRGNILRELRILPLDIIFESGLTFYILLSLNVFLKRFYNK